MAITVSQLTAFDPSSWETAADWARTGAKTATTTADELNDQAAALDRDWPDPVGAMASAQLRGLAASYVELATGYRDGATVIEDAAGSTDDRRGELVALVGNIAGVPHVEGPDDHGVVRSSLSFPLTFPPDLVNIVRFFQARTVAGQLTVKVREILMRAEGHDREATIELMSLVGIQLPPSTDGPIDLSDTGIVLQADLNGQDGYGSCVSLSTLISIAHSDPDFVRDHMKWDPATGTYQVTLYDDGKPVTVSVDPTTLPADGSDQAATGKPSWLAIYEQAIQQQFGDIKDGQSLDTPIERITGQGADTGGPLSTDEIRRALDRHPPAVVTTATSGGDSQPDDVDPTKRVVENHAYTVRGIDSDGNIVLQNPWGPNGGYGPGGKYYPGEVHLTPAEYERWFGQGAVADLP